MNHSILMLDWTRHNEVPNHGGPQYLVWHQVLCAFLHEDVLAQDETIVMSRNLPEWFGRTDGAFAIARELFECGGLKVLRRPLDALPDDLRDLAVHHPIAARRQHLIRNSVDNEGNSISAGYFKADALAFHDRLDVYLREHRDRYRFAGAHQTPTDRHIFDQFGDDLVEVLLADRWSAVRDRLFPDGVPDSVRREFASLVGDPEAALARIARAEPGKAAMLRQYPLRFSTAIAVAVARTFPSHRTQLQDLIESVFAKPYCRREGAAARVGPRLMWLPEPCSPEAAVVPAQVADHLEVQPGRGTSIPLPALVPGFANAVLRVKEMTPASELRAAVAALDELQVQRAAVETVAAAADRVVECWEPVADELARELARAQIPSIPAHIETRVFGLGRGAAIGATLGLTLPPVAEPVLGVLGAAALGEAIEQVVEVSGDFLAVQERRLRYARAVRATVSRAVHWSRMGMAQQSKQVEHKRARASSRPGAF